MVGSSGTLKVALKVTGLTFGRVPVVTGYQAKPEQRCPPHSSSEEEG